MNVTFLVGNGFDLQMGLRSSFTDFERHYVDLPVDDPAIIIFKGGIAGNIEKWSDFENKLGDFTAAFPVDEQDQFLHCLDDYTTELIKYLSSEEAKYRYFCVEIRREMRRSFRTFNEHVFSKVDRERNRVFKQHVEYRFISFNYTHVFDWYISNLAKNSKHLQSQYAFRDNHYKTILFSHVIHVHGELPGPVILGVDNTDQIRQEAWATDERFKRKLIKPEISKRAGSSVGKEVESILHNSDIICIYGMSLGETDKKWWVEIGKWLLLKGKKLFIQVYTPLDSTIELTHQKAFELEDRIIDRFCDYSDFTPEERAIVESKITVLINPDMFNIRNIIKKLKSDEKDRETLLRRLGYEN